MISQQIYINKGAFIDSKPGKVTAKYKLLKELGRGISGVVYKACAKDNPEKLRAIKKVSKDSIKEDENILNEVKYLRELDHPDIIRLYETYEDSQYIYYVIDFCEGGELFDYLDSKGCLTEREARTIFFQMISAVRHCHSNQIAHRDLKPENFLLLNKPSASDEVNLKLIDFGLAFKWKNDMEAEVSKKKKLVGTAYYISPQVISGKYDQKCDLWSLGVILYILVTGAPPFDGDNDKQILKRIIKMDYKLNIPQMSKVSLLLKDLIKKLLMPAEKRINLNQVFQHPWMTIKVNKAPISIDFKAMANFSKFSKIKTIAATYIASQMTAKQMEKYEKLFKQLDENHDGYLSLQQFNSYLEKNGGSQKEKNVKELKNLFDFIDTDKNGKINYTEFIASTVTDHVMSSKKNLENVFNMLDKDGNGYVDRDEIMGILSQHGHISNQRIRKDADEIFNSIDVNRDGKIDFQEFVATICKIVE